MPNLLDIEFVFCYNKTGGVADEMSLLSVCGIKSY